jgi:hypothetical protein
MSDGYETDRYICELKEKIERLEAEVKRLEPRKTKSLYRWYSDELRMAKSEIEKLKMELLVKEARVKAEKAWDQGKEIQSLREALRLAPCHCNPAGDYECSRCAALKGEKK